MDLLCSRIVPTLYPRLRIDINTLFEGDIKTIEQYPLDEIISKSSATLIIDEDRRVFNEQVHYFDHPQFGIMIYLKKLSGF